MLNQTPLFMFALMALASLALANDDPGGAIPFDDARWDIQARNHRLEEYLDRPTLYVENGTAVLHDVIFQHGVIEYDVAVPERRGFVGCMWRMQDAFNYEDFYIRPHQSGNPDATQYTPAHFGLTAWQLYTGPGHAVPVDLRHDAWMHVKIVVAGDRAEVYLDSEDPVLFIDNLRRDATPGSIGLTAFTCPAHFANFSYEVMDAPPTLKGRPGRVPPPPVNVVRRWEVSNGFAERQLEGVTELAPDFVSSLTWSTLDAESTGITNLAPTCPRTPQTDTVVARLRIRSDAERIAALRFGYSDRVRVYCNGRLLYVGDNGYRTRDYRYLGTIGLFDTVALPLEAGDNEVWFAVSENFGGWGIMGAWADAMGIEVRP